MEFRFAGIVLAVLAASQCLAQTVEGVDVTITQKACILHGSSVIYKITYQSKKPVRGGEAASWGLYVINLTAPPGFKLYASDFLTQGEGQCADADKLDVDLNVVSRTSPGWNPAGTVPGLMCGVHERDLSAKPASGTSLSYQWKIQGHNKIAPGGDGYQHPYYNEIVDVYWEPIKDAASCDVSAKK